MKDLQEYVRIRSLLIEIKNIKKLLTNIQKGESCFNSQSSKVLPVTFQVKHDDPLPQFIFICGSSGTGKTQLPFSLNIPLLYFCLGISTSHLKNRDHLSYLSGSNTQSIYKNYPNISVCVMNCLHHDIFLLLSLAGTVNDVLNASARKNLDIDIPHDSAELLFPGLICFLCERIKKLMQNKKYSTRSWMINELCIEAQEGEITRMTILQARNRLHSIFDDGVFPCIFLDECQKHPDDSLFEVKYVYLRRSLRLMGLIGIFIGTNANIANYITLGSASTTRGSGEILFDVPWSFIIYSLAPMNPEIIRTKKIELLKEANTKMTNKESFKKLEHMIDKITTALKNERSLFVNLIFKILQERMDETINRPSVCYLIDIIIDNLIVMFNARKYDLIRVDEKACQQYNTCNCLLIQREVYGIKNERLEVRRLEKEKATEIHIHIAHLYVPDEIQKIMSSCRMDNCFGITVLDEYLAFSGTIKQTIKDGRIDYTGERFKNGQYFKTFKDEPFIQSRHISRGNFKNIFTGCRVIQYGLQRMRLSSMKAVMDVFCSKMATDIRDKSFWVAFEFAVATSALVATQCNGYAGCSLREWLRYFIRELRNEIYEDNPPNIEGPALCADRFNQLLNTGIPLCAPRISASWNESLESLLSEDDSDAYVGVLNAFKGNTPGDFYISDSKDNMILVGECKISIEECVEMRVLNKGIEQLMKPVNKARIKILVVNRASNITKHADHNCNI